MSINFSANQYEQAFTPPRIANWEVPKDRGQIVTPTGPARHYSTYPEAHQGFSTIHANDRGHLLPNVPRSRQSPWGTHVGTWDMPTKIPGNKQANPTARCEDMQIRLQEGKAEAREILAGGLKKCKIPSPMPVRIDTEAHPDNNPPSGPIVPPVQPVPEATRRLKTPVFPMNGKELMWPRQGGAAEAPVGNVSSPKPPTPMNLGGEAVQREARVAVSPCNPEQVAVRGAVATPQYPIAQQMRTPEVGVNWPMAKSAEPC